VIVYFDTSSVVPLIIEEPSSTVVERLWNEAERVVSVRLLYPEARAALARAERMARLTASQHAAAVRELDTIVTQIDHVEVTPELAFAAGELAHEHGLRGYDAVHLAAATRSLGSTDAIATGDAALAQAATTLGIAVARTS
jgi:predicted nucleic acid-binding protein